MLPEFRYRRQAKNSVLKFITHNNHLRAAGMCKRGHSGTIKFEKLGRELLNTQSDWLIAAQKDPRVRGGTRYRSKEKNPFVVSQLEHLLQLNYGKQRPAQEGRRMTRSINHSEGAIRRWWSEEDFTPEIKTDLKEAEFETMGLPRVEPEVNHSRRGAKNRWDFGLCARP